MFINHNHGIPAPNRRYQTESAAGKQEEREIHLEEGDAIWAQLRHCHIAEVYTQLHQQFSELQSKNKAANAQVRATLCWRLDCVC